MGKRQVRGQEGQVRGQIAEVKTFADPKLASAIDVQPLQSNLEPPTSIQSAILVMWTGKPVLGSSDISSNTLKPSPVISV